MLRCALLLYLETPGTFRVVMAQLLFLLQGAQRLLDVVPQRTVAGPHLDGCPTVPVIMLGLPTLPLELWHLILGLLEPHALGGGAAGL